MTKNPELSQLAGIIINIFNDHGFDAAYVEDKIKELQGMDKLSCLTWCNSLDVPRKTSLALRLNVSPEALMITIKTLQHI